MLTTYHRTDVGREIVEELVAQGMHQVTVFSRKVSCLYLRDDGLVPDS